jgi:NADH-quinone oxidoreductase subunit M
VLSLIVFLPLLGVLAVSLLPKSQAAAARWVALAVTGVDLVLAIIMVALFDVGAGMQFVERFDWIPQAGIQYFMGVDGISMPLVALSALLTFLAVLASWKVDAKPRFYFAMILLLQVGMNGIFAALDFVLFYVFWELVLVPMYFLIAQWGGPRREYAAIKFFLYTLLGSVFMLVGIVAMFLQTGTFDMIRLAELAPTYAAGFQWWVFLAFFLGFAVKVPVFPLHTWLPDAHVEAPTAGSVLLAGVMLKMGTYGFIRVSLPMLPEAFAAWQWFLAVIAVVSIVYGAAVAFAQTDVKKLVAYSSVSHMGFAMLGIASGTVAGINGAMAVNISHGLITGMLFLMVGMIYDRAHTRQISELSGVAGQMPIIGGLFAFASFASMGLPGLSGFVGEFLALLGAWMAVGSGTPIAYWMIIAAAVGVLLGAAYMLWMLQRVVLGEPSFALADCTDSNVREIITIAPLVVLIVVIGVYWGALLRYLDPAVTALVRGMGA